MSVPCEQSIKIHEVLFSKKERFDIIKVVDLLSNYLIMILGVSDDRLRNKDRVFKPTEYEEMLKIRRHSKKRAEELLSSIDKLIDGINVSLEEYREYKDDLEKEEERKKEDKAKQIQSENQQQKEEEKQNEDL